MVFSLTTVCWGVKWTSEPGHWAHYGDSHGHTGTGCNGPGVSLSLHRVSRTDTNIARMPPLAAYCNRSSQIEEGGMMARPEAKLFCLSPSCWTLVLAWLPWSLCKTADSTVSQRQINNNLILYCEHNYYKLFLLGDPEANASLHWILARCALACF